MMSKFVRRRTFVVTAVLVVLGAVVAALAGGTGARTSGKDATRAYGIVRASSADPFACVPPMVTCVVAMK